MELIGQYDSPFVRRVGIALRRYGMEFRQQPWSVWADADELARLGELRNSPRTWDRKPRRAALIVPKRRPDVVS